MKKVFFINCLIILVLLFLIEMSIRVFSDITPQGMSRGIIDDKSIKPKTFLAQLQDGNIVNINRENLERDSRYFPGLKTFNKNKLIRCILKNLSYAKSDDTIEELENLADIKKLINHK